LVFVHGIGGPRRADRELRAWSSALAEGCRAAYPVVARALEDEAATAAFAYYGDLFTNPLAQGGGDGALEDDEAGLILALLDEIVESQLEKAGDPDELRALALAREMLEASGQTQGPGQLVGRCITIATTLLAVPRLQRAGGWASEQLMIGQLRQVVRYLRRGEPDPYGMSLDTRIRARVEAAIDADTQVVVAHSLGSVVAFEALEDHSGTVPLLITIGSPLTMRTVVLPRLRSQPPRCPESIAAWLNFWNKDDIFSGRSVLEKDILPNDRGVGPNSSRVPGQGLWTHTATKYLEQPAVADPAAGAISGPNDPDGP
jgi:hypothetical protein